VLDTTSLSGDVAGFRPGDRVHSFASPKERNQEKATRVCRPAARGAHASGTEIGKRRKLAALRQPPLLFPISAPLSWRHTRDLRQEQRPQPRHGHSHGTTTATARPQPRHDHSHGTTTATARPQPRHGHGTARPQPRHGHGTARPRHGHSHSPCPGPGRARRPTTSRPLTFTKYLPNASPMHQPHFHFAYNFGSSRLPHLRRQRKPS
jgi:hypothetical protein